MTIDLNKPTYHSAIMALCPNAEFATRNGKAPIEWHKMNGDSVPTEDQIQAKLTALNTDFDNKEYQRKREAEYPSVVDQLDDIYHNGIDAWKATIKTTKDKYPKP